MVKLPIEKSLVRLRPLTMQDAHEIIALEANPDVQKFVGGSKKKTAKHIKDYISGRKTENDVTLLVVEESQTREFLGRAGLLPHGSEELEVFCVLKNEPHICGKGYGIATFQALVQIADALNKEPVAVIHPKNIVSHNLVTKIGFAKTGTIKGDGWDNGYYIYHRQ